MYDIYNINYNLKRSVCMRCEKCDATPRYNEKYDSYYCPQCNEWIESKCGDESCEFCKDRPERPFS